MINLLESTKNCHIKVWMQSVSLSNLSMESLFSFTVVKRKFENPSFAASSSLLGNCLQETRFSWIFSRDNVFVNFLKYQLVRSWGFHPEVWGQVFQTSCKIYQSGLFSIAWLQRLAKNSHASFLNWKTCMLVTFLLSISLFDSYFIPKPKLTLLIFFQFVLSATSSFISTLSGLALSTTSFLTNFTHNDLKSVSRLSAGESLSVWYRTRKEFNVFAMSSKNCNFRETIRSFWIEKK